MSARHKLNAAAWNAIVLVSVVVGYVTGSVLLGIVAAAALTFTYVQSGAIRFDPSRPRGRRGK